MLKAGIAGSGFIGSAHAAAYSGINGVELAAIADVNEAAGKKAAEENDCRFYNDFDQMLKNEDIDIVDICLPTFLHEKYVIKALEAGKHVICEKPFALRIEEAENMVKTARSAGVRFMIAQVIRFWPEYVKARELYRQGTFGTVKMVHACRLAQHPDWTTWHRDVEKSGGGLFDLHIHDIDYMCFLFGDVERVYAVGEKDENNCWNHVFTTLEFKNGVSAAVEGAFEMTKDYPFTMSMRINGTEATFEYLFSAGFNLENTDEARRSAVLFSNGSSPRVLEIDPYDAYTKELEYFTGCVRDGVEVSEALPENSLYVLKVIHAARESLESGKVIRL